MNACSQMEVDSDYTNEPKLESRFRTTPLEALNPSARRKIASYLDDEQEVINTDIDMLSDWRGLAELVGYSNNEIQKFGRAKSSTYELLSEWELGDNPSIGHFWSFMLALKRYDVLTDCKSIIERDARKYIKGRERRANDYIPTQDNAISSTSAPDVLLNETDMLTIHDPQNPVFSTSAPDQFVNETKLLTIHDQQNPGIRITYDAFVCYNEQSEKDTVFVKECIKELEHKHGLQLLIPSRDCLAGGARYVGDAALIKSRCKRMVIVVSNDFLFSAACDFQVKFAHALAPGARKKRLIPVLMEEKLKIPDILRHVTICDFTKPDLMEWFWDRLASSIKAPLDPEEIFDCNDGNRFTQSTSVPVEKHLEKMDSKTSSWPTFPVSRRQSSDSNSSGFSLVSVGSLSDECHGNHGTKQSRDTKQSHDTTHSSIKRHHERYVSFEEIIPPQKQKLAEKIKRFFSK